jgi:hypothetical protein
LGQLKWIFRADGYKHRKEVPAAMFTTALCKWLPVAFCLVAVASIGLGMMTGNPERCGTGESHKKEKPATSAGATQTIVKPQDAGATKAPEIKPRVLDAGFIKFSPDGKHYVTAVGGGPVALYETTTGKEIRRFKVPPELRVHRAFFSPDGKDVAVAALGGDVCICEVASGKLLCQLEDCRLPLTAAFEFSPEGNVLAGLSLYYEASKKPISELFFWERSTGKKLAGKWRVTVPCTAFAFSDDGKYFLAEIATFPRERDPLEQGFKPVFVTWTELWRVGASQKIADVGSRLEGSQFTPGSSLRAIAIYDNGSFRVRVSPGGKGLVFPYAKKEAISVGFGRVICVTDTATGRELARATDTEERIWGRWDAIVLSRDGNMVAAVGSTGGYPPKSQLYIWDISKAIDRSLLKTIDRSEKEWAALWESLGNQDMAAATRAFDLLFATPEKSCVFLQKCLLPIPARNQIQLKAWLADLDNEKFAIRENAQKELEALDSDALPVLIRALNSPGVSLEKRRRLEPIVNKLKRLEVITPEVLRVVRAIELLEQIDTPASRELLEVIAKGEPNAWVTTEASASLKRLEKRR